ncbi:hypothetical protein F5Y15DRAFT_423402 [Xylariaceae sp. FL0016]|nr:hypothetical protein F5Y15DRAFT_423402 [Xylariaceae sp. FL0016]
MATSKARGRFRQDLKLVTDKYAAMFPNIEDLAAHAEEEFSFTFNLPEADFKASMHVTPQDVTSYPHEIMYLVYTKDAVSSAISSILSDVLFKHQGKRVGNMLKALCQSLRTSLGVPDDADGDSRQDIEMTDVDFEDDSTSDFDLVSDSDSGNDDYFPIFGPETVDIGRGSSSVSIKDTPPSILQRFRQDCLCVREAGLKVGIICGFEQVAACNIVSTAVRAHKLKLSDETLGAWNLKASDYVVLLIQYSGQLVTVDDLLSMTAEQPPLQFRLRKSSKHRPTIAQALSAFSTQSTRRSSHFNAPENSTAVKVEGGLELLGIGESIDMFLDKDFLPMLKIKHRYQVSWESARTIHSQTVASLSSRTQSTEDIFPVEPDGASTKDTEVPNLPPILKSDHMLSKDQKSLPLAATQCALRYFVRCTNYCMICHKELEGNLESLKPYVCSSSLCLFQYMSMGLGPSIDHEIISQPYVVDLLISFCYIGLIEDQQLQAPGTIGASKRMHTKIREYPVGLNLQVPSIGQFTFSQYPDRKPASGVWAGGVLLQDYYEITFDWKLSIVVLITPEGVPNLRLREGRWIVICTPLDAKGAKATRNTDMSSPGHTAYVFHHAKVRYKEDKQLTVDVSCRHVVPLDLLVGQERIQTDPDVGSIRGYLACCDRSLDDLPVPNRALSMMILLASLPSVTEMRSYLMENPSRQLATWERITPAAMRLLRWIIASNRSYIVQVGKGLSHNGNGVDDQLVRYNERISGVSGWMQFRFAQGSPEKEALFREALQQVQKPKKTILAWHGSATANWHSIIRQGLNFERMSNGRAYGDGVYFSPHFDYSLNYSTNTIQINSWPRSSLNVQGAMSLNELVNEPEKFVSAGRCLVVQHCHWIQCRYLFVRLRAALVEPPESVSSKAADLFIQDERWRAMGPYNTALSIPKRAIPSAQENGHSSTNPSAMAAGEVVGDSEDEDEKDLAFLFPRTFGETSHDGFLQNPESQDTSGAKVGKINPTPTSQEPLTDFRPGTLDYSRLPQLTPPSYATDLAQKVLGRELRSMEKIQSMTSLHELGWYIDFNRVTNLFQWIVELHSFDPQLPLAKDMKSAGITSIVLEIRFLQQFPLSPPFVRVVQPRFLPFMNGGGGHVTAGGAMCMELLTNSGWSPANSLESVLLQVRMALCSLEPRPARLENSRNIGVGTQHQYGIREAVDAYTRAAQGHGWEVPKDLRESIM